MRLKSALRRGVAAAVIAGIVVSSGIPAYAARWDIADGDITVKAGDAEGTNRVTQGEKDVEDTDTVITGESKEHTVTIDTSEGNVDVTFDDLKIDASDKGEAAVRVEGNGDATIELDGKNELKSGGYNAGLEKDGHRSEGTLTIKDDKGKDGSLTAEGGFGGAGIGGGIESTGSNIKITGGTIEAVGGEGAAGIGGGVIGGSWAVLFAMKGLNVKLYDINEDCLANDKKTIVSNLEFLAENGAIEDKDAVLARIQFTTSMEEAVKDAQFIQESGPERLPIKHSMLAEIEKYAPVDAIVATSASGLPLGQITEHAVHPERCVGGHPYNPPLIYIRYAHYTRNALLRFRCASSQSRYSPHKSTEQCPGVSELPPVIIRWICIAHCLANIIR